VIVDGRRPRTRPCGLDQKPAAVVWTRQDFKNSHASPILIRLDGQEQLVAVMDKIIIGVDPATGELLWSHSARTIGEHDRHNAGLEPMETCCFVSQLTMAAWCLSANHGPPILAFASWPSSRLRLVA